MPPLAARPGCGWVWHVVSVDLLNHQPTLGGALVRLEPMGPEHFEGLWPLFSVGEEEGPLADFAKKRARAGLERARMRKDRADWAIVTVEGDNVVGEAVLMDFDEDAESMSYRIALVGPEVFNRGYGSESTVLVRDFAFGALGLHRLALEVTSSNAAAILIYTRAGFVLEGVRRQVVRLDGAWRDVHDMALLDSDPRP